MKTMNACRTPILRDTYNSQALSGVINRRNGCGPTVAAQRLRLSEKLGFEKA
ncbi:hypothetical protein [Methanosarcina sp.]|uniref:hypothetical protein n=1 Tax=Methanosarcina sp. TaxID=2213 RepID=UPI003C74B586